MRWNTSLMQHCTDSVRRRRHELNIVIGELCRSQESELFRDFFRVTHTVVVFEGFDGWGIEGCEVPIGNFLSENAIIETSYVRRESYSVGNRIQFHWLRKLERFINVDLFSICE
jgi:hypothetical protein